MQLLVVSDARDDPPPLLASLEILGHDVLVTGFADADGAVTSATDLALVDATTNLGAASSACRAIAARGDVAVIVVAGDGVLAAVRANWGFDDLVLRSASPGEVETRLRLATERARPDTQVPASRIGDLVIDEDTYVVRLRGRPLDLTYREFELLKFLASRPRRVFTREQLLQEVWGYDYFGGTRTVDVHIRRLRAKLGAEHELIGTVRGVGYKLDPAGAAGSGRREGTATVGPPRAGSAGGLQDPTDPAVNRSAVNRTADDSGGHDAGRA